MISDTYCPELWRSISIDNRGNVYSCCLNKPLQIGNINMVALRDIINDESIIDFREQSLQGRLQCHDGCTWVRNNIKEEMKIQSQIDYDDLETITIAFGEACNISCIMCKQRKRIKPNDELLNCQALIKNVDISPFQKIFLTGGEPLMMEECRKYMRFLASVNKKFGFSTNGMLLNEQMIEFLTPNLDFITFSLNAATKETHEKVNVGSSFSKVQRNIHFLKMEREKKDAKFPIVGRMTLTTLALDEIPLFIKNYSQLGFDKINFGFDKATVLPLLEENPEFTSILKERISQALCEVHDRKDIDIHRLRFLNLVSKDVPTNGWWEL